MYLRLNFTVLRPYNSCVTHVVYFEVVNGEFTSWSTRPLFQGSNGSQQAENYCTWVYLGYKRELNWRVDGANDSVTKWTDINMTQGDLN